MERPPTRRIPMSQLRPCDDCGGPLLGKPFQIIRVTQALLKRDAIREQISLAQLFDGSQHTGVTLAEVMGARGDDMVLIFGEEHAAFYTEVWVCQDCAYAVDFSLVRVCEQRHVALSREQAATEPAAESA